ncbi:MAG: hypothetical protein A2958_02620 [Candidatus Levybacteria bacterium RIFCSPLOWO2_01_FULL_38_13]|nr:MAG: hypothetical protein A2629_03040 [Candidatus Levybacteria bacterium RIFCSPHIGHO2_01_FULL_41_15]OGH35231.1 MAG: hypothetical protein A2958_02620 [Candidatus Levybacteria bacterium RIFCSPLOWO2_01_FULL_38_13]
MFKLMSVERSFGQPPVEVSSFRAIQLVGSSVELQPIRLEPIPISREGILFSRIDEEKDVEASNQAPEANQDGEPIPVPVNGDWEPFNLDPHQSQNFVNLYGGPFSQQMELNRTNAERLLQAAGIEGKVIIADLPMDRSRSIAGVNTDGSVTGRRRLFWGEKVQEENGSQSLVRSIPEGWRIEIPGQEMMEELSRKKSKTPMGERFIAKINQQLRQALSELIIKEKLTPKNPHFDTRIFFPPCPL